MTAAELILLAVVIGIGLPSARFNATAAALVIAYLFSKGIYWVTGNGLAVQFYVFPDILVLAVIFAKPEWCSQQPYRGVWHQLGCVLLERSPSDRLVMLIYVLAWALYVCPMDDFHKWWSLWGLSIAQFLAVGAEALDPFRRFAEAIERRHDHPGNLLVAYRGGEYG